MRTLFQSTTAANPSNTFLRFAEFFKCLHWAVLVNNNKLSNTYVLLSAVAV